MPASWATRVHLATFLRDDAKEDIRVAARRRGNDDPDGFRRVGLRGEVPGRKANGRDDANKSDLHPVRTHCQP